MSAGVSDELRLAEHVVFVAHCFVAPAVCAEKIQAGEAAEGEELHEHPYGHVGRFPVSAYKVSAESVTREHGDFALSSAALAVIEARHIIAADGVTIFVLELGDLSDELGSCRVLNVQGER